MLFLEGLRDKFAFFQLIHFMSPVLVFLIESSLLYDHLLKQVFLGFEDKNLSESFLMLFEAEPGVMVDLLGGNFLLILSVHVQNRLVNVTQVRPLLDILREMDLRFSSAISINVSLSGLIQSLQ